MQRLVARTPSSTTTCGFGYIHRAFHDSIRLCGLPTASYTGFLRDGLSLNHDTRAMITPEISFNLLRHYPVTQGEASPEVLRPFHVGLCSWETVMDNAALE
jgi:hypothetical protein